MDTTGKMVVGAIAIGLGAVLVWLVERKPTEEFLGPLPACPLVPGTVVTTVVARVAAQG